MQNIKEKYKYQHRQDRLDDKLEIWKDIPWYEWLYQASNLGNIKSLNYNHTHKEHIMKARKTKYWYLDIELYNSMKKKKRFTVHRLIALTYISNLENKPDINHIDWNKSNNNKSNLEWCTKSENALHSIRILNNKNIFQINHPRYNLWKTWKLCRKSIPINQYSLDWVLIKKWACAMDVTKELGIKNTNIWLCCKWVKRYKTAWWFIWKYNNDLK